MSQQSAEINLQRESQASKVTSTPVMSPILTNSPSISTIGNEEAPMEVDFRQTRSSSEESQTGAVDLSSLSLNDSDIEPPRKSGRVIKELKWPEVWRSLKPKNQNGLFYKLLTHPTAVETTVIELIYMYTTNKEAGVVAILQLFVELCGYKKLPVAKYYQFAHPDAKAFVHAMATRWMDPELKKTGKFLFMKYSKFETLVDEIISRFIQELVVGTYQNRLLFDEVLTGHIFEFINVMAFNAVKCIRVTGIILAVKFLTTMVDLYRVYLLDSRDDSSDSCVMNRRSEIESFIDFLYIIFEKNCLIVDPQCYLAKVKCAQEICQWVKWFPEMFLLKRKCLKRLLKLVEDRNEVVRLSALAACEEIIKDRSIANHLSQRIDICLETIAGRFVDVKHKVAVKAITIFTAALETYSDSISRHYRRNIINRMFETNLVSAKAAGLFLASHLQRQHEEPEERLVALVKIAFLNKENAERLPFFLESIVQFLPQLQDWHLIVRIILNSVDNLFMCKCLLAVLNELVRFAYTGKFSMNRPSKTQDKRRDETERVEIASAIVPNVEELMITFQRDKGCLKQITEILKYMNGDLARREDLQHYCTTIFNFLGELFKVTTDKALLEEIAAVFSSFCRNEEYTANTVMDTIKTNLVESLLSDLNTLSPNPSRLLLLNLRETSMKLSVLFAKFNLTNILKWEDIFQAWDNGYLKALQYLIVCCKWHLVWSFKQFKLASADDNGCSPDSFLFVHCKDFVYGCLELLKRTRDSSEGLLIFEELCDFYANFERELKRQREFSYLVIHITEKDSEDILTNFVVQYVMENTRLPLGERQKYLCQLVDVINLGIIPVENFSRILRYYDSHHVEFGPILTSVLQQLYSSHPALPLIVLHTMTSIYKSILEKYSIVEVASDESKQLKLLSKRFATMKEMKSFNNLKFVNMAIAFAFKDEKNYPFLYFTRYFAQLLNTNGKKEAYDLFTRVVPEHDRSDNFLLLFSGVLKSRK